MCGIVGTVDRLPPDGLLRTLVHRGPDGKGEALLTVKGRPVWLGHTRLSILDPSPAGQQPMKSQDGRWWLTFNGEIYNHLDLRKNLAVAFRGHSDTETLVELIAELGVEAGVKLLNGMFAFAALDTKKGTLYLARDPFGIKPLYICSILQSFAFASEMRALKAIGMADQGIDADALHLFLTLRYTPSPETLLKGVKRIAPGTTLCLDIATGSVSTARFVSPVTERFDGSIDDAVSRYQLMLYRAVQRQLLSDVPVGILLSGGIDSALVAAMAKDAEIKLPCFSVGFGKGYPECEIADAAETARALGLPFESIEVNPVMLRDALPDIVRAVEEPLGTTSILPMWYLVKLAKQNVSVVLTGQGTDEPWGGYTKYQMEMVRRMAPWGGLWRICKGIAGSIKNLPDGVARGLRSLPLRDMAERATEAAALFTAEERFRLTGSADDGGAAGSARCWLGWLDACACEPAEKMMRMDTRMNLSDDLLLYGDKISMAVSLEARIPMLDIELVRFVEGLPLSYRVALGKRKIVHKRMAERYLSGSIVYRRKKGFGVPFGAWSRGVWREFIEGALLDSNAPHLDVLDQGAVREIWNEQLAGHPGRSRQVFALLMLALWWRQQDNEAGDQRLARTPSRSQ